MDIAEEYGIYTRFSKGALKEAQSLPVSVTEEMISQAPGEGTGRLDLRGLPTVTIDGADTKDYDDAVSLVAAGDNWQVGVHIADVSEYVREGSALDQEALRRGTSFYPAGRVIPMLPAELSNGICSLNTGVDRLTVSCLMTMDREGNLLDYHLAESVIHVDARLTYDGVVRLLEEGDESEIAGSLSTQGYRGVKGRTHTIAVMLRRLGRIAAQLRRKREERGSLGFDFPESNIELDDKGRPVRISAARSNIATELIEELMILANETVAKHCCLNSIPCVYRVHAAPEPAKLNELRIVLRRYGYQLKPNKGTVEPRDIAEIIEKIEGTPEEAAVSRITLRSMQKACYAATCDGHFGLALEYYCHFTSPIRRYPDLLVHRCLKEWLRGRMTQERRIYLNAVLPEMAKTSSDREQRAMEAEREAAKLKKAQYMQSRIGETYEGVISGVTGFGLFVELPNTVEGMIYIGDLIDDDYYFDENRYILVGETTGRIFALGDPVTIVVSGADPAKRNVDFIVDYSQYHSVSEEKHASGEGNNPKGKPASERGSDPKGRSGSGREYDPKGRSGSKEGSSLKSRNGSKKKYSLKKAGGRGAAKYSGRISGRKSADDFGGIAKGRAQEPEEKETVHGGRTRLRRKKDRGRMDSTGRVLHGRRRQGRKTKRRN